MEGKGEALYCSWGKKKKKSISAPEIGYFTRKDIARYNKADMKYYFSKVLFLFFFFNLIASAAQKTDQIDLQGHCNSLLIS